jgi:putative transposase
MSRAQRRALVERTDPALPGSQQCRLLAVSRSSVDRRPAEVGEEDRAIMALLDRQYLARPDYGSRRIAAWLATQGHLVNRKRVQRLMRLMGLVAIYQRPNTSKAAAAHKVYPYLLGGIERVNQVWCSDVRYIPMAKGFLYLVVVMDWVSRAVLAWRLSNTLGADFCVEALEEALSRYGRPEIFNTDQSLPWRKRGAVSSPATISPARWRITGSPSASTARGAAWTTSSWSGCGEASNTRRSPSTPMRRSPRPRPALALGLASTMRSASTRASAIATPRQIYHKGLWIGGRSALPTGSASPASRASSESREMLAFAHIPTGATANKGFDVDEVNGRLEPAIAVAAIGADSKIGRATP